MSTMCSFHPPFCRVVKEVQDLLSRTFTMPPEDFAGLSRSQRLLPKNSKFLSRGKVIVEFTRFVKELMSLVKDTKDFCQG